MDSLLQLVFGENPRVPHKLLSDDQPGDIGLADLQRDASTTESASGEFARRFHVRQNARKRAMEWHLKDRISGQQGEEAR